MLHRVFLIAVAVCMFSGVFAQKKSIQYRSDGKNAFSFSVMPGFDKFIRETQDASRGFGLGIEGNYTRTINSTIDVRVFQRYHQLMSEDIQPDTVYSYKHSYLATGATADISILNYDRLSIKISVGPQVGYAYKIRLDGSSDKTPITEEKGAFGGFELGMVFETYPVKYLVLGIRLQYDQWFSNGEGNGNIYPGPYIGARF